MSMTCKAWPQKPILKKLKTKKIMEKERKITAPDGCEIEKVEIVDGVAVVTFKQKEQKLPKSWEEFCEMYPCKDNEYWIEQDSNIEVTEKGDCSSRSQYEDKNMLPDCATAEAVLSLCQLIQLRDCYNGDWVPDWEDKEQDKYTITIIGNKIETDCVICCTDVLYFKTEELRDEFLSNFSPLIEKLKPLYGIKEGGEE